MLYGTRAPGLHVTLSKDICSERAMIVQKEVQEGGWAVVWSDCLFICGHIHKVDATKIRIHVIGPNPLTQARYSAVRV